MSKITKTIAALGVVAGLGVAALPLASYAATTDSVTVNAEVGTSMSVSLDKDSVSLNPIANGAPVNTEGGQTITATAITNNTNGYRLTLTDADSTNHYLTSGENHIAPGEPTQGESLWGVKFGAEAQNYVSIASAPVLEGEATTNTGDTHTLNVGVSASAGQVPGTYTGTLTVTITAGA